MEKKFRAWHTERKEWILFVIKPTEENVHETTSFVSAVGIDLIRSGKLKNWCQYIGLKDKNGEDVFEGDVFEAEEPDFESGVFRYEVVFERGMFLGRHRNYDLTPLDEFKEIVLLGNVYLNPELLQEQGWEK